VALSKKQRDITQNVTNKGNILNTRIRQLPGSGRVVMAGYLDPVPGEFRYPSHLY